MRDSENVLNSLAGHSSDLNYKFERLYRLLFNENLYALAYQNIAPNEGSCTKGADGQSISGMSVERIQNIINRLKDESYQPYPAKRVYIPKKNGKKRPLGIPTVGDRVAQMVVVMTIEPGIEPYFHEDSYA
jgi:retron-type reverse transcriptase